MCLAGVLALNLAACGAKDLPDTYAAGSDHQYGMDFNHMALVAKVQTGERGTYVLAGGYIYLVDGASGALVPLCNKADCLHDHETDARKAQQCNASVYGDYNDENSDLGIQYCNGYLYLMWAEGYRSDEPMVLWRFAADGSSKERIWTWERGVRCYDWIVHRDVLYYIKEAYAVGAEGEVNKGISLCSINLTGPMQERTIREQDEDSELVLASISDLNAYGNHLYFSQITQSDLEISEIEANMAEHFFPAKIQMDLTTGEMTEIGGDLVGPEETIVEMVVWKDKLLFSVGDVWTKKLVEEQCSWYTADLDGSNAEPFTEVEIPARYGITTEGKYLYVNNLFAVDYGAVPEDEGECLVYDQNHQLVDTVGIRFRHGVGMPWTGTAEEAFYAGKKLDDNGEIAAWVILRWDKSGIGSYQGSDIELDELYRVAVKN